MAREKAPVPSAAPASDKKKAIEAAMSQIEKMYGKGSIMRLGDNANLNVEVIPTGSLALDLALGIGGAESWRFTALSPPVRPPWPSMWWRRPRREAATWPLWMPSTPWTPPTPVPWG